MQYSRSKEGLQVIRRVKVDTQGIKVIMEGARKAKVYKGSRLLEEVEFVDGDELVSSIETLKEEYSGELQESFSSSDYNQWKPVEGKALSSLGSLANKDSRFMVLNMSRESVAKILYDYMDLSDYYDLSKPIEATNLRDTEIVIIDNPHEKVVMTLLARYKYRDLDDEDFSEGAIVLYGRSSNLPKVVGCIEKKSYYQAFKYFTEFESAPDEVFDSRISI